MVFINVLLVLVLLALILLLLLSVYPIRLEAEFNSLQQIDAHVLLTWLYPFLKVTVIRDNGQLKLTVYLFNNKIFKKNLAPKASEENKVKKRSYQDYINYARSLDLHHVRLYASYGFEDPSVTGMVCGAIDLISQAIVVDDLYNNADFLPDWDYFNIEASAEINAATSLIRVLRIRRPHLHPHPSGGHK